MEIQYIYLLKTKISIDKNENVYKIGKTKRENYIRFNEYPEGSILIHQTSCINCSNIEKILIKKFDSKYIKKSEYGREYFEGDYACMKQDINYEIDNENPNINIEGDICDINDNIIINNTEIIDFFKMNKFIEPNQFILHFVNEYKNSSKCGKIEISSIELKNLYQEYQEFINNKNNIVNLTNSLFKEVKTLSYRMKLKSLDDFCSKNLSIKQENYSCNFCGFSCTTTKGIITHKRNCVKNPESKSKNKKKNKIEISSEDEEDDEN